MKKLILLLLFLLSLSLSAQSLLERYAARLVPPARYVAPYVPIPPVIDGHVGEAEWGMAVWTAPFVDICGALRPAPRYATQVKMLCDDTNFYVAARLEEPNVTARLRQRDTIVWRDNDFEVFIDPNGDGVEYFEIEVNPLGTLLDLIMTYPYRSGGTFLSAWDCPGLKVAVSIDGTLNNSADLDRGWWVEMAIPHEAIRVGFNGGLKQGRLWRVNFSRVEWLMKGADEENWVWSPTGIVNMHMPERWGFVYLCPEKTEPLTVDFEDLMPDFHKPHFDGYSLYQLMWTLFYAEQDYESEHKTYAKSLKMLPLSASDRRLFCQLANLKLEATTSTFEITARLGTKSYSLNHQGLWCEKRRD